MGINGLIPFLEKSSKPTHVSQYSGYTVAVDVYCWLHKGAFSCAEKLARGDDCDTYVHYCMKYVNMLLSHNIKPILVFDGQRLPAKGDTEKKRQENREMNRRKAAELMRLDRAKEAASYLRRCVDISHEMAFNLMRACRARNVDCVVAPFEADAQLAYFSLIGFAQLVITEDSDLLLFGAKAVLFKMDINGNGLLIERSELHKALGEQAESFSLDKFRYMCILSGCDYLASLPGIGLTKAWRFVKRTVDLDIHRAISRIGYHLNMNQLSVSKEYRDNFLLADFMFKHQPVFDVKSRRIVPLTEIPEDSQLLNYYRELISGTGLSEKEFCQLAYGNMNPITHEITDTWDPDSNDPRRKGVRTNGWNMKAVAPHPSIWSEDFTPKSWNKTKAEAPNALCRTSTSGVKIVDTSTLVIKTTPKRTRTADGSVLEEMYRTSDMKTEEKTEKLLTPSLKKSCKNPWLKNDQDQKKSSLTNVGALSKITNRYRSSEDKVTCNVISRYFSSPSDTNETNIFDRTITDAEFDAKLLKISNSIDGDGKPKDALADSELDSKTNHKNEEKSPTERTSTDKESDDKIRNANEETSPSKPSVQECRSPLKNIDNHELADQPVDGRCNEHNTISKSGDDSKDIKSVNSSKKKGTTNENSKDTTKPKNPFAVKKDKPTVLQKSAGNFTWQEKMRTQFSYSGLQHITEKSYKDPTKNEARLNAEEEENSGKNLTQLTPNSQDMEDEGFCSPSIEEKSNVKQSWTSCRKPGLSKNKKAPVQKSLLSTFAYKKPEKLKL